MRALRDTAVVVVLMGAGTWLFGWWAIPILSAIVALWHRRGRRAFLLVVVAAALSWGIILWIQALFGSSLAPFDRALAISLGVSPNGPLVLTVLLPVLLAATAAGTVIGLKQLRRPRTAATPA
ncbi:MAG: hypothetical protein AB1762_08370 [Gemmatimonadota bacterium]